MKNILNTTIEHAYESTGKATYYFGVLLPIFICIDSKIKKATVTVESNQMKICCPIEDEEMLTEAIQSFYIKSCKKLIAQRIAHYQQHFKVKPRNVSIENSLTKWGTCNGNRDLMFNWHLMMTTREFIDYVVVHEMCHMVHLNHDRSFWRLVGKIFPNYKKCETYLQGKEA